MGDMARRNKISRLASIWLYLYSRPRSVGALTLQFGYRYMINRSSKSSSLQFDLIGHLFDSARARVTALGEAETPEAFGASRSQLVQQLRIMARCVDSGATGQAAAIHATYSYLQTVLETGAFADRHALATESAALIDRLEQGGEPLRRIA